MEISINDFIYFYQIVKTAVIWVIKEWLMSTCRIINVMPLIFTMTFSKLSQLFLFLHYELQSTISGVEKYRVD